MSLLQRFYEDIPREYYIYIITNEVTGKQYVGEHYCNDAIKDNYMGSGSLLQEDMCIYPQNKFSKRILMWFFTKKDAQMAQQYFIELFDTAYPLGYNKNLTGMSGKWSYKNIERRLFFPSRPWRYNNPQPVVTDLSIDEDDRKYYISELIKLTEEYDREKNESIKYQDI